MKAYLQSNAGERAVESRSLWVRVDRLKIKTVASLQVFPVICRRMLAACMSARSSLQSIYSGWAFILDSHCQEWNVSFP